MKINRDSPFFYGWVIIAVGIITGMLVYGARYSFSVFFPKILDEFGWSRGSTALMVSINVLVYGLMAPVAGTLGSRWKPQILMPAGVIILSPWLGGYIYDTTGSYENAFILCIACIVLGSVSYWIAAPRNARNLRARRLKSHTEKVAA